MLSKNRIFILLSIFFVAVNIIGCASKPNEELADAESALEAARAEGAENTAEYKEAEELIAKAKQLMADGKQKEARELLEEARFKAIQAKGAAKSGSFESTQSEQEQDLEGESLSEGLTQGKEIFLNLVDLFFDYDQSGVRSDAKDALDQNVGVINSKGTTLQAVIIEGYCDSRGTDEYNLALGQRRAESIKSYLVGAGISPSLVQAVSKGETEKWGSGTSEYAYQQNRRAHFVPLSN
ncbi:MAG: OmpA family protein [Thermodesulfobacteriota bacterium]